MRPVFDYDSAVESKVKRGVHDAFAALQEVAARSLAKATPEPPRKPGTPLSKEEQELLTALGDARRLFEEHAVAPEDEDFEVLAQLRFAPQLAQATVTLVELAHRAKIVASRDELSRVDTSGISCASLAARRSTR